MAETNIRAQIKKLVELQKIDGQIFNIKRDLRDKPLLLEGLKQQFEGKKMHLYELEEKHKASLLNRKTLEGDLKSQEEAILKANGQLSLLKTNKEYTARMTEIEGMKATKAMIEEKILLSYDESDGIKAQIDQEKGSLAKEEEQYLKSKKEIEAAVKEVDDKLKVLTEQRQQNLDGVDKTTLQRYERILTNKDGLAIVPVQNGACGGCFMNMPPQVVNEIKMHEKMTYCEMCARILYLADEL